MMRKKTAAFGCFLFVFNKIMLANNEQVCYITCITNEYCTPREPLDNALYSWQTAAELRITLIAATKSLTKSLDHNTSAGTQRVLFCIFAPTQDGYFHPEVGAFFADGNRRNV